MADENNKRPISLATKWTQSWKFLVNNSEFNDIGLYIFNLRNKRNSIQVETFRTQAEYVRCGYHCTAWYGYHISWNIPVLKTSHDLIRETLIVILRRDNYRKTKHTWIFIMNIFFTECKHFENHNERIEILCDLTVAKQRRFWLN